MEDARLALYKGEAKLVVIIPDAVATAPHMGAVETAIAPQPEVRSGPKFVEVLS